MNAQTGFRTALGVLAMTAILGAGDIAFAFQRNITFCNRTREPLKVAIGYDRAGTSESTSSGWHNVGSCSCRTVLQGDLRATEFFLLTTRQSGTSPLVAGRGPLCVHPTQNFRYVSQNSSRAACNRAGGQWINFAFHDTGANTNHRVNFRFRGEQACNL